MMSIISGPRLCSAFDSNDRKRLYKEAKTFLKVRSMRNKLVKKHSDEAAAELVKA